MELVAVHDLREDQDKIIDLCIGVLNWEWPRSYTIRKRGLLSSSANLPTNLVLILRFPQPNSPAVLGHARISKIPADMEAVFIESVVVHPELRQREQCMNQIIIFIWKIGNRLKKQRRIF